MTNQQLIERLARKFKKHCARMRTDISMIRRSKKIPDYLASAIEQEIAHILVQRNITYPPILENMGISNKSTLEERKKVIGIETKKRVLSENENKFIKFMENSAQKANQAKWRFRIAQEAKEKAQAGWYPFFITITVDPKIVDSKEMWQSGRKWQSLVKRLSKIASNKMGHDPFWKKGKKSENYRPITDYLTYAAVIEHGKSREHHHLHALIWLKDIPEKWKQCPNRNANGLHKIHNRCRELETYWKLGRCTANYFRSIGDIWEIKHGFALPLKEGKPMKVAPVNVAGAYLTKYLQKDHKEWQHRVKATRNLGMKTLKKQIAEMEPETVEALTWRAKTSQLCHSLSKIHTVPLGLVRQIATQQHFLNQYRLNQLDTRKLMSIPIKPYIKMLKSVQDGARPDRMPFGEFYDWLSRFLPAQKGYCEEKLKTAHEEFRETFNKVVMKSTAIKIGGNNIGYSYGI